VPVFNYFEKITFKNDADWCLSDPELIITDPDPANNFGSGSGSTTLVRWDL